VKFQSLTIFFDIIVVQQYLSVSSVGRLKVTPLRYVRDFPCRKE